MKADPKRQGFSYACGHTSNAIIMNDNPLSMAAYLSWSVHEGREITECFDCYLKRTKESEPTKDEMKGGKCTAHSLIGSEKTGSTPESPISHSKETELIAEFINKLKEAGRQSAQKEWDDGAKLGVEQCRQNFLTMLNTAFKNGETKQRAEKQEQVLVLKEVLKKQYKWDDYSIQTMDNIFPDCADKKIKGE